MPNTPRLALPVPAEGDVPDVPAVLTTFADKLDEAVAAGGYQEGVAWYMQGTLAQRPAAGTRGRFYWATDTGLLYRDDGAAWTALNPASAQPFLDAPGQVFQEGVMSGGGVTRLNTTDVRVAAGSAWIDGDSIAGFGAGRYFVSWPQTDITGIPAEAGAANRVDQIIVQLTGSAFSGTCSVQRLAGASQAGGTTLTVQTGTGGSPAAGRVGAAALPAGSLRLADLLINVNGVQVPPSNNNIDPNGVIRDRRPWARGAHFTYHANGIADLGPFSGGVWTDIDPTNMSPRLEIASGAWELDWGFFFTSTDGAGFLGLDLPVASNGAAGSWGTADNPTNWATALADERARRSLKLDGLCAPGSYRFNARWATGGGTSTMYRSSAHPLSFTVREIARPSANNGMG
jgi:hypothetical protein